MKNFFKKGFSLLLFLGISSAVLAQYTVSGKVVDEKGEALPGVSVVVKGTTNGSITDLEGQYSLSVKASTPVTLVFSFVGYATIEQNVSSANGSLNVTLAESTSRLEEVIVTGLASNIKRANAATSVARITGDELNGTTRVPTLDGGINGKLAGALIQANSGAPGGGFSAKLRGISSINLSSEPLYVIDGIIVDNSQFATGAGTRAFNGAVSAANAGSQDQASNRISDINPNDIESIEVLKGPSASAIYGTRANAGVIVIQTKRGKSGKTQVKLSQDVGMSRAINLLKSEDWTEAKINTYNDFNGSGFYGADKATAISLLKAANGKTVDYDKEFFGETGRILNTNVSVSGGNDKTKFYVAGGYNDETGIMKNTGYTRYSARVNIDHRLNDWVDVKVSSGYYNTSSSRGFLGNDNNGVSIGYSIAYIPNFYDIRPTTDATTGKVTYPVNLTTGQNPFEVRDRMENKESTQRFLNSGEVNFRLLSGLKLSLKGGVDYLNSQPRVYAPEDVQYQAIRPNPGASRYATNIAFNTYLQSFLTYNWKLGSVELTSQAGLLRNQKNTDQSYIQGEGLLPGQRNPSTAAVKIVDSYVSKFQDVATDFSQDFNWEDKLIGRAGIRFDKSSLNGDNTKWYAFPRASLAINLTKFSFLENSALFSQLKPRIAFGRSGGAPLYGDIYSTLGGIVYGGNLGSVAPTVLGNGGIEPETAQEIEYGIDFGFLKNRILFEATYFDKRIFNLLDAYVLSPSTGASSIAKYPIGDMSNKGIELSLTGNIIKKDNFDWSSTLMFWNVKTKMEKLNIPSKFTGSGFGNFGRMRLVEGFSPTLWWGRDANGNSPVQFGKDAQPKFQTSWRNSFRFYKNLEFTMFWHASYGGWIASLTRELKDEGGTTSDWSEISSEGVPNGISSRLYASSPKYTTENYLIDASYLRLREVSLYYNVPMAKATNNAIGNIRVGVSALNLINFSPAFKATYDPEASNFGNQATGFGVDLTPFPSAKRMFFHLNVDF